MSSHYIVFFDPFRVDQLPDPGPRVSPCLTRGYSSFSPLGKPVNERRNTGSAEEIPIGSIERLSPWLLFALAVYCGESGGDHAE